MKTIALDVLQWDWVLDSKGNIALASDPYSQAQDVASAVRLFLGELWFDQTKGIPYFENVLGKLPPVVLLSSYIEDVALTVPGVVKAVCLITGFQGRAVTGQVRFITEDGTSDSVNF